MISILIEPHSQVLWIDLKLYMMDFFNDLKTCNFIIPNVHVNYH